MSFGPFVAVAAFVFVAIVAGLAHGVALLFGFDLLGYVSDRPSILVAIACVLAFSAWQTLRENEEGWSLLVESYAVPNKPPIPAPAELSYRGVLAVDRQVSHAVQTHVDSNGVLLVRSSRKVILIPWTKISRVSVSKLKGKYLEAEVEMVSPSLVVKPEALKIIVPWDDRFAAVVPVELQPNTNDT